MGAIKPQSQMLEERERDREGEWEREREHYEKLAFNVTREASYTDKSSYNRKAKNKNNKTNKLKTWATHHDGDTHTPCKSTMLYISLIGKLLD